jgi:3-oxoacyl-[acyl-carrier protein] reductase
VGGVDTWPNGAYYGATKAALIHLTRHLALELEPDVRVNAVAPDLVDTDMTRGIVRAGTPTGSPTSGRRPARPAEVADLVVFLASPRAALVSGETLVAAARIRSHG